VRTLLKTNDPVLLNYAEVLLRDAGIDAVVFDAEASVMDGSMGMLPRRLMVADEDEEQARTVLSEGLGKAELEP
jgi:Putative prokaryotic signal transducing protein